ncbi:hypothetical protein LINPERHAP2_LOCUS37971 [Linum perenne]
MVGSPLDRERRFGLREFVVTHYLSTILDLDVPCRHSLLSHESLQLPPPTPSTLLRFDLHMDKNFDLVQGEEIRLKVQVESSATDFVPDAPNLLCRPRLTQAPTLLDNPSASKTRCCCWVSLFPLG